MQKSNCTTACRGFTIHHLGLLKKKLSTTIKYYCPFIGPAKYLCSLDQGLSVRLWSKSKFHWWCLCCYRTTFAGFCIFFYFLVHNRPRKQSFSLKLSSLLYRDDRYESLLIFFFFSALLASPLVRRTSKFHHGWKKLLTINLLVLLVDNFFFSVIYLSIFALFLICSIVTGNSRMILQSTLFILFLIFRQLSLFPLIVHMV